MLPEKTGLHSLHLFLLFSFTLSLASPSPCPLPPPPSPPPRLSVFLSHSPLCRSHPPIHLDSSPSHFVLNHRRTRPINPRHQERERLLNTSNRVCKIQSQNSFFCWWQNFEPQIRFTRNDYQSFVEQLKHNSMHPESLTEDQFVMLMRRQVLMNEQSIIVRPRQTKRLNRKSARQQV